MRATFYIIVKRVRLVAQLAMEVPYGRLVMVRLVCKMPGCAASEPLHEHKTPFCTQVGLFACPSCTEKHFSAIKTTLRNCQPDSLFQLLDEDRTDLLVERTSGALEYWRPVDMKTWSSHFNHAATAPVVLDEDQNVNVLMMTQTPPVFRHHKLSALLRLNPSWKPTLMFDGWISDENRSRWATLWQEHGLPVSETINLEFD